MRQELSLGQLAQEIERQRKVKLDIIAKESRLEMAVSNGGLPILHVPTNGDGRDFTLRPHAHGQLAQRLGIPKKYYDRMLSDAPDLLTRNVNTWFGRSEDRRLVRVLDQDVRAVLSDRYQRIENDEIAEVALPILMEQPEMQIVSSAITETRLYIKAVFPRIAGEVKKGDLVQSGVVISNSEIGMGAVKIEPLVYRLVCLNGMISQDLSVKGYHVGRRAAEGEDVYELLSDEARAADDRAILLKARDLIRACADQTRFAKRIEKMKAAAGEKVTGDPAKAIEVLAQKAALTDAERGSVLRHLIEGGDLSRWGVLNAVTRSANDHADYDRATELEAMGGQILELGRGEWREIAEAA